MALIVKNENEYEDLLGLWSDLESGLGLLLSHPSSIQELRQRVEQYDHWMQDLLMHDPDVGLYLLFQLAIISPVGYSASHSLVCAVLCHLISVEYALPEGERNSLVRAALTMNIAMTALQDTLATQTQKPSTQQQQAIQAHASQGAQMLEGMGVQDELWLKIIKLHHQEDLTDDPLAALAPPQRLAHILHLVDRYAAMISPRQSREGRSISAFLKGSCVHRCLKKQATWTWPWQPGWPRCRCKTSGLSTLRRPSPCCWQLVHRKFYCPGTMQPCFSVILRLTPAAGWQAGLPGLPPPRSNPPTPPGDLT